MAQLDLQNKSFNNWQFYISNVKEMHNLEF